jgi:hypothetical protein
MPVAYTIMDFAKLHGLGRSTVYNLINNGTVVARKIGTKAVRIFADDNPDFRERCAVIKPGRSAGSVRL